MSTIERSNPSSISRRDFLKGIAAGAVAAAVVAVGIEEYRIAGIPGPTETVTTTAAGVTTTTTRTTTIPPTTVTTTAPGPTTTVTTGAPPPPVELTTERMVSLTVNGVSREVTVPNNWTLFDALTMRLKLVGAKLACDRGECGSCTVIMDGKAVYSCMVLAVEADGSSIETIEGLGTDVTLDPIQQSFVEHDAMQCGYCTPGMVMATKALLRETPRPTREQVLKGLSGNICTCSAAWEIVEAVLAVR